MNVFRHGLAAVLGIIWLAYCVGVLKYTCDRLPLKTIASHQPNEQQNKADTSPSHIIDIAKDEKATNENTQQADSQSNQPKECDWCAVNWAGWVEDAAILVAAYIALLTLRAIKQQTETSAAQLRAALHPSVKVTASHFGKLNDSTGNLGLTITSVSTTAVRIERVDYHAWIAHAYSHGDSAAHAGYTLVPSEQQLIVISFPLSEEVITKAQAGDPIHLNVDLAINFIHPIDGSIWRTYRRMTLNDWPKGKPIEVPETSIDWDGRFGKSPPKMPDKYTSDS